MKKEDEEEEEEEGSDQVEKKRSTPSPKVSLLKFRFLFCDTQSWSLVSVILPR